MSEKRLIDANALISDSRICGNCKDYEICDGNIAFCPNASARRAINDAPTVEDEPVRHGHWIYGECGNDKYIKCSFCRKSIVNNIVTLEGDIAETAFALCPKCGAKMDGGEGDDG